MKAILPIFLVAAILPISADAGTRRPSYRIVLIQPGEPGEAIVLETGEPPQEIERFSFDALPTCRLVQMDAIPSLTTRYARGTIRSAAIDGTEPPDRACTRAE